MKNMDTIKLMLALLLSLSVNALADEIICWGSMKFDNADFILVRQHPRLEMITKPSLAEAITI